MSELQVKINGELWESGRLFVCPDQDEELEVKATDLENTEIAKSFEQELREHNEHRYKVWSERIKDIK
jgi:hypothetical protein